MDQKQSVSAIKKMVIGCIIAEYGARQLVDSTKYDLKKRLNYIGIYLRKNSEVMRLC